VQSELYIFLKLYLKSYQWNLPLHYSYNALKLQESIQKAGRDNRTIDIVKHVIPTGKPVLYDVKWVGNFLTNCYFVL
jgi:hypothetical protein